MPRGKYDFHGKDYDLSRSTTQNYHVLSGITDILRQDEIEGNARGRKESFRQFPFKCEFIARHSLVERLHDRWEVTSSITMSV